MLGDDGWCWVGQSGDTYFEDTERNLNDTAFVQQV